MISMIQKINFSKIRKKKIILYNILLYKKLLEITQNAIPILTPWNQKLLQNNSKI